MVTPVTNWLPFSLFKRFHCSVRSRTGFKASFWMQAADRRNRLV
jgi:hypothetical protein